MFLILSNGKRVNVADDKLNDDFKCYGQSVGVFDNETKLKKIWYMEIIHDESQKYYDRTEATLVKARWFRHEPTEDEILYEMAQANAVYPNDFVTITTGYMIDDSNWD